MSTKYQWDFKNMIKDRERRYDHSELANQDRCASRGKCCDNFVFSTSGKSGSGREVVSRGAWHDSPRQSRNLNRRRSWWRDLARLHGLDCTAEHRVVSESGKAIRMRTIRRRPTEVRWSKDAVLKFEIASRIPDPKRNTARRARFFLKTNMSTKYQWDCNKMFKDVPT